MEIKELLDAGQDILGAVSDAVDTGDYSSLAGDIQDIVLGQTKTQASGRGGQASRGRSANSRQAAGRAGTNGGSGVRASSASGAGDSRRSRTGEPARRSFFLGERPDGRKGAFWHKIGRIGAACFFGASALSVVFFALARTVGLRPSPMGILILTLFLVLGILCLVVSRKGKKEKELIARYYTYAGIIDAKEYFSIEEVANASGQTPDQVRKDMEELRKQGIVHFLVMDRNKTTVMLSQRMVREYEKAEASRALREKEEKEQLREAGKEEKRKRQQEEAQASRGGQQRTDQKEGQAKAEEGAGQDSETDALLREGYAAIRTIREINDRIPDDHGMSGKLYRLENTMKRIFERVQKDPSRARDIRRLMNYYLPTTIKLLKAYAELYEQPTGGENVEDSKRQIEGAMDTINDAFEKLLDDMFQDQAWDIASDINVMKTMMAQDGLVDDKETEPISN